MVEIGMTMLDNRTDTICRVVEHVDTATVRICGDPLSVKMYRVTDGQDEWRVPGWALEPVQVCL